jgi:hypothetical protein
MKRMLKYLISAFTICLLFNCQSNNETDHTSHVEGKDQQSSTAQSKKIISDTTLEALEQIQQQESQRKNMVLTLEDQIRDSCIPITMTDSIFVVLIIEPEGTLSFADVYKSPSEAIKNCILDFVKNKKVDFGQVVSAGSSRNKSGKTMHQLVLTGSK